MKLLDAQIAMLAGRSKVRRIAVENFLSSMEGLTRMQALGNLYLDAGLYGWNAATVAAIRKGIELAEDDSKGCRSWRYCVATPKGSPERVRHGCRLVRGHTGPHDMME